MDFRSWVGPCIAMGAWGAAKKFVFIFCLRGEQPKLHVNLIYLLCSTLYLLLSDLFTVPFWYRNPENANIIYYTESLTE